MFQQKQPTAVTSVPEGGSVMAHATVTGSTGKTRVARAKEIIAQHPLIAFFAFAFAFSWTIWFLIPQSNAFSNLGVYGPWFAAVVISAIIAPEKVNGSRARHWALFALVFAVAFAIWVLFDWRVNRGLGWLPGAASAAMVAFLVSGPLAGRRGVRDLFGHLAQWRVGWSSYAAALILGPAILLLAVGLDLALGGKLPPWPLGGPSLDLVSVTFAWILLFGGGDEEPGWRGFALPRLQSRFSPLVASVILGFFWALWHAPLYFVGMYTATSSTGPAGVTGLLVRFIWVIPLAIIFTWLYNRSRQSLLIMFLLHAAFNTATAVVGLSPRAGVLMVFGTVWAIGLVVLVSARMWRKQQSDVPSLSELTEPLPPSKEPIEAVLLKPSPTSGEPPAASPT